MGIPLACCVCNGVLSSVMQAFPWTAGKRIFLKIGTPKGPEGSMGTRTGSYGSLLRVL